LLAASIVSAITTAVAVLALPSVGNGRPSPAVAGAIGTPPADPGGRGPHQVGVTRQSFTRLSSTSGQPQPLDVVIWYPAMLDTAAPNDQTLAAPLDAEPDRTGAPYPLVLYSHGTSGFPWSATYLSTHLASHGFVVIAPAHHGSSPVAGCPLPCTTFNPPARTTIVDSITNRPDELIFLLDQEAGQPGGGDPRFQGLIDTTRTGLVGHSFGGYTVLHAAARDHRFRAVVAFAPWATPPGPPRLVEAIPRLSSPTMLMQGKLDDLVSHGGTQSLFEQFESSAPEHWHLKLPRAGHAAFTDLCPEARTGCGPNGLPQDQAHALINRWTTAFLLRHVADDERYATFLDLALAAGDPELQVEFVPGAGTAPQR
jgi:predicted dienelactone hydrolase